MATTVGPTVAARHIRWMCGHCAVTVPADARWPGRHQHPDRVSNPGGGGDRGGDQSSCPARRLRHPAASGRPSSRRIQRVTAQHGIRR